MKMYVGVTDPDWFKSLKASSCDEVNFWKPGGKTNFTAINEGDLFLFKLHSPDNYIVGGGFFLKFSILPISLAWDAFGIANGANHLQSFTDRVYKYKNTNRLSDPDPQIGCVILSTPFFFDRMDWIPVPQDWKLNIVQGRTYDTGEHEGLKLYQEVQQRIRLPGFRNALQDAAADRYGKELMIKPRIGQGAFKILITDAYQRRCAITGEKTLPVLEAAHIKPYSADGPHEIANGLLLRRDFHTLFDRGYITVDQNLHIEVSHRIKEDFGNGKEYYAHHGQSLVILPRQIIQMPDSRYLEWHNEHVYLG